MTYDNENDSVLSFDSNDDRDNIYGEAAHGGDMDQYDDFDAIDASG